MKFKEFKEQAKLRFAKAVETLKNINKKEAKEIVENAKETKETGSKLFGILKRKDKITLTDAEKLAKSTKKTADSAKNAIKN